MELFLVPFMVAGFIELVKRAFAKDWQTVVIIAGAGIVGGVCGYFELEGIDIATGVVAGLSASGLITVVQNIQQK